MKISIIIPIYNVAQYLEETINSVLKQSYENIEILLINDGSTDNSRSICKKYTDKYDFIYLIDKENGGVSDARNMGINNASGDYIIFLDSDDYWEDNLLGTLVEKLSENKKIEYLFFRHFEYYQEKGIKKEIFYDINPDEVNLMQGSDMLSNILSKEKYFPWYVVSSIIKTDFIKKSNLSFEKGRSYEDVLWSPTVFLKAENVEFIDKALYVYRRERPGQITSNFTYNNLKDSLYVFENWIQNVNRLVENEGLKSKLINNISMRYFFAIWFSGFLSKQEQELLFKELREKKHLFTYKDTPIQKVTIILLKTIGFSWTSSLFKFFINIKRSIQKRS